MAKKRFFSSLLPLVIILIMVIGTGMQFAGQAYAQSDETTVIEAGHEETTSAEDSTSKEEADLSDAKEEQDENSISGENKDTATEDKNGAAGEQASTSSSESTESSSANEEKPSVGDKSGNDDIAEKESGVKKAEKRGMLKAANRTVSSWAELKAAVEAANADSEGGTIIVNADFNMEESLTISKNITISGNPGAVLHRAESISGPMFNVTTGELTLGSDLVLNGTPKGSNKVWSNADQSKFNRGVFVEVGEGGKLVIDGATIKDFKSKDAFRHNNALIGVSPIYVKGGFEMKSGSITGNEMGAVHEDQVRSRSHLAGIFNAGVRDNSCLKYSDGGYYAPNSYGPFVEKMDDATLANVNAGAVYFDGGSDYKITGGTISKNKGHAGALVVAGGQLYMKGEEAVIENNWADHFGTVFVASADARFTFCKGYLQNNTTVNAGGVLVAKDATMFLMGGHIEGNRTYGNGGGILVYSDKVYLLSGYIRNNGSSDFGGGVYIYGDDQDPTHSFVLTLHNVEISGNEARALGVTERDDYIIGPDYRHTTDDGQYNIRNDEFLPGSGGGLWMCPAGIVEFDGGLVNLYGNAAGNQGGDFHKDAGFEGGVLIDFGPHNQLGKDENDTKSDWYHDEKDHPKGDAEQPLTVAEATSGEAGRLSVYNKTKVKNINEPALYITGNVSRRGGGVGTDGSLLFVDYGDENPRDVDEGQLSFAKEFIDLAAEPMEYDLILADEEGNPILDTNDEEVIISTFRLFDKDWATTTYPLINAGNLVKVEWPGKDAEDFSKVNIKLPPGQDGFRYFSSTENDAQMNVIVREYRIKEDNTRGAGVSERFFSAADPEFVGKQDIVNRPIEVYDVGENCQPVGPKVFNLRFRDFSFNANAKNQETPEIEKYINEAVHSDIAVDDEFTYNILAYVTTNADEVVITDTLNDQLKFISEASDVKVYDLGTEMENDQEKPKDSNHLPVYTVDGDAIDNGSIKPSVADGTEIAIKNNDYSKIEINGQTLTVKLANKLEQDNTVPDSAEPVYKNAADDQEVTPYRGHYIRIEFKAQLSDAVREALNNETKKTTDLEMEEIKADTDYPTGIPGDRGEPHKGNDPVKSKEDHKGIANTASYEIKVGNEARYQDTSNTVTVKPEIPKNPDDDEVPDDEEPKDDKKKDDKKPDNTKKEVTTRVSASKTKTGDEQNALLWMVIAFAAALGAIVIYRNRKRER